MKFNESSIPTSGDNLFQFNKLISAKQTNDQYLDY